MPPEKQIPSPHMETMFEQVTSSLRRWGMLLLSDAALPSVASLIAQEVIRGSWWGHPKGREIYEIAERLAAHADVTMCRLLAGKVTYLHRDLWPIWQLWAKGGRRGNWRDSRRWPAESYRKCGIGRPSALTVCLTEPPEKRSRRQSRLWNPGS